MNINYSYSSTGLLHECARKYELEKLLTPEGISDDSLDLVAGGAFGIGLQHLLNGETLENSVWAMYKKWTHPSMDKLPNWQTNEQQRLQVIDTSRSIYETNKKKAWWMLVAHLEKFLLCRPEKLEGWRVWNLPSGRAAIEVGFRVRLPNGSYHRGFIDAILVRDTPQGTFQYAVLEIKTSSFDNANQALYQNSAQGNCYAFVADYITKTNNPFVFYFIAEFPKLGQQVFDFWKSTSDKVSWLPSLALDMQMVDLYMRAKHFPMNGAACYNFFRACKYLGVCNLARTGEWIPHKVEPTESFDYDFTLEQLLEAKKELYGN